ncbi:hypothetical protein [Streptomyces atratus]|uniref:hypothetical protein n=1 Tax=Streptomyces atratus TaxID=1893 RepID=UPI0021A7E2F3|nr:hypothetical protein [Streptomyces atratus]MCT2547457.1 hypothetical protein [Streptomyces atratus]
MTETDVTDAEAIADVPKSRIQELDRRFAAPRAIGFHLVDYVVHGWDVAASLGIRAAYDADLVRAAAEVARKEVPDGPSRERPGASFRPAVELAGAASAEDRLLAALGRDPRWSPEQPK